METANKVPVVKPDEPVNYATTKTPSNYVCGCCGATGVKLWREYQTFLNNQSLLCITCSGDEQKKDVSSGDAQGFIQSEVAGKTDQIGWRIPAVPTKENDTYWGYTSVPPEAVDWWRALPTFPANKE